MNEYKYSSKSLSCCVTLSHGHMFINIMTYILLNGYISKFISTLIKMYLKYIYLHWLENYIFEALISVRFFPFFSIFFNPLLLTK